MKKISYGVSRIAAMALLFVLVLLEGCSGPKSKAAPPPVDLGSLLKEVDRYKQNDYFTVQVSEKGDGSDVAPEKPWVTRAEMDALNRAMAGAQGIDDYDPRAPMAATELEDALVAYKAALKANGSDPYFRGDPGAGIPYLSVSAVNLVAGTTAIGAPWSAEAQDLNDGALHKWRANDGRLLWANDAGYTEASTFELIPNPFEGDQESLIKIHAYHDPAITGRSFGGFGIRVPLTQTVSVDSGTYIEFDLYYPMSAAGQWMRLEWWSTDTGNPGNQAGNGSNGNGKAASYIRTENLTAINNLNPDWIAFYDDETWSKQHIRVAAAATGTWQYLNMDFHTETGAHLEGDALMIGGIRITKPDPEGIPIPLVSEDREGSEKQDQAEVAPIRGTYNQGAGSFMVGAIGTGTVEPASARGNHYEIFVNGNNLKAESVHPRYPQWLTSLGTPVSWAGEAGASALAEYTFPTAAYQGIRDSHFAGEPAGGFKSHGHVLAWYNQAPVWMRQMVPEHLGMTWNEEGAFYAYGNGATGPFYRVSKEEARRVYFNHIMYELRHFMTLDVKYGSSPERGIIPFHSFDVLNEEIHESRHSTLIAQNPDGWKGALKSISWLAAMTDDAGADLRQHYIYLLFKYAHIAVPNAQMAAKFKERYTSLPDYMKQDGHDYAGADAGLRGNIDAYITAEPPRLTYNDYGIATWSKAKTAYNMIKELNTLWQTDELYDGRPLIEVMGIQGHDAIGPTLASDNQQAIVLYASLIDAGLLSGIAYSELDLKLPDSAPGGGAIAPAVLNQKQADALGYQYALLYKLFTQYAPYMDHIISWGLSGSGWGGSYVLFNSDQKANQGYYGVMDPDRFILGHAYLDEYFKGEYAKVQGGYTPQR